MERSRTIMGVPTCTNYRLEVSGISRWEASDIVPSAVFSLILLSVCVILRFLYSSSLLFAFFPFFLAGRPSRTRNEPIRREYKEELREKNGRKQEKKKSRLTTCSAVRRSNRTWSYPRKQVKVADIRCGNERNEQTRRNKKEREKMKQSKKWWTISLSSRPSFPDMKVTLSIFHSPCLSKRIREKWRSRDLNSTYTSRH